MHTLLCLSTAGKVISFHTRQTKLHVKFSPPCCSWFHTIEVMNAMQRTAFSLVQLLLLFFFLNNNISEASDTISQGQSLSSNQTLVSKNGRFVLGFFTPGKSRNYYIGIWFRNFPNQTIVWVANREAPVTNPSISTLTVSENGNLVLINSSKNPVWSSNLTLSTTKSTAAVLLDSGNLVLINGSTSDSYLWQSFEHPTDTVLPGGWIGVNKITGETQHLNSWKNSEDPSPGLFTESMQPDGSNQYVILWNQSKVYWTSGLWTGQYFANMPGTQDHSVLNFSFVDNKERKYVTYTVAHDSIITRGVMDTSGQVVQWIWLNSTNQWQGVSTQPLKHCDVYSLCGPFGVCDEKSVSTICRCSDGFQPANDHDWELNDWSRGCMRKSRLQCGDKDGFLEMSNMRLPANPENSTISSGKECKDSCMNNCSCIAYAYGSNGCSIWKGELWNLQQLSDGDSGGGTLFLRLLAIDIPRSGKSSHNKISLIVGVVFGTLAIICTVFGLVWVYRRRRQTRQVEGSLIQFTYSDLQRMTKNFSEKLGSGGFGTVFKGTMSSSTAIAVKKLEGLRQGEKQFRAEVSTLGAIQHVNLVRLCGFCIKGSKRLLVYEFMPGGSLDSHLFRDHPTILNWKTRYHIALGTARGLDYLHEKCRERIIHCDIKPDNILLDEAFSPKVSDFGLAKLYDRDFSRVLTTIRGTLGYLAPEWISGLEVTPKVDVYSYGMMLFELISGRRNRSQSEDESPGYYPSWAAKQVIKGEVMSILDARLEGAADVEEVSRICKVAIWCVQDMEGDRPSMGQVVQLLEGVLQVSTPPIPRVLQISDADQTSVHYPKFEQQEEDVQ